MVIYRLPWTKMNIKSDGFDHFMLMKWLIVLSWITFYIIMNNFIDIETN